MNNLFRFDEEEGYKKIITPDNSNLTYVGLSRILLQAGGSLEYDILDEELVIVLQKGDFKANIKCKTGNDLNSIEGSRSNVFDALPSVIYIPPRSKIWLESQQGMEALVYSSPSKEDEGDKVCFLKPYEINEVIRGALNWRRRVRMFFGPQSGTKKIIIGESISVPGGWIGFPPHKHDTNSNDESPMDEIYSFKVRGPHGAYALHHTYDLKEKKEEHYTIDGDMAIAIPKGYHTTTAVPGCQLYMLWGLAHERKIYKLTYDTRFTWLNDAEVLF